MNSRFAVLALAACAVWPPALPRVSAQATLTPIFTNGPASNRINIVVLSEGYQTNQLGQFLVDATNAVNNLWSEPPYHEYSSYFNAYAISVESVDSGSDHPLSYGITNNTYFNSAYDTSGYQDLLTIPPNNYDANYNHGQGKVDALVTNALPKYGFAVLLVNDPLKGSSALFQRKTLINYVQRSIPSAWMGLLVHESGHAFGNLGDEYESNCAAAPAEYANVTAQTNRDLIKWRSWILDGTPVPTPETTTYADMVGLFQGAQCQSNDWYRPKFDCRMRTLGKPFCEVCAEQIVKSIYQQVRSIDSFTPASKSLSLMTTQVVAFSVSPLQPLTHHLGVQWFTNGIAVPAATNAIFNLFPKSFTNGTHTLRAEVRDATLLVLNDPANLLSNSITWTLTISLSEMELISPQWQSGDRFSFCVTGVAPQGFVIEASTNFANWVPLTGTNYLAGGRFNYTNSGLTGYARRFYRTFVPH